jgi:hypothetical protein
MKTIKLQPWPIPTADLRGTPQPCAWAAAFPVLSANFDQTSSETHIPAVERRSAYSGAALRREPPSSIPYDALVFIMWPDPKPVKHVTLKQTERAITAGDPDRPDAADFLEANCDADREPRVDMLFARAAVHLRASGQNAARIQPSPRTSSRGFTRPAAISVSA